MRLQCPKGKQVKKTKKLKIERIEKNEIKWKLFYTLREDLKDEESISGNLLVKSGMFKKVGNGIYMKMPLGKK